jgi:hypothetical protein
MQTAPGFANVIGDGVTAILPVPTKSSESERETFAKKVRELVQPWFEASQSDSKAVRSLPDRSRFFDERKY